jgi:type II secretory pathway component PulJ
MVDALVMVLYTRIVFPTRVFNMSIFNFNIMASKKQPGFLLLEIIVGLMIMSLSMAIAVQGWTLMRTQEDRMCRTVRAISKAASLLSSVEAGIYAIAELSLQFQEDGYTVHLEKRKAFDQPPFWWVTATLHWKSNQKSCHICLTSGIAS